MEETFEKTNTAKLMWRVALTGPESVGKSTLAQQLAEHFRGAFVSEFARDYVANLGRDYTLDDVEKIARQQINDYLNSDKLITGKEAIVFFDTFLIITKIWFEVVYKQCPMWLDKAIRQHKMDLYLLCYPDLPWIADGVRENESSRLELFERYKAQLEYYDFRYEIVNGSGAERLSHSIEKINTHINEYAKIPHRTQTNH